MEKEDGEMSDDNAMVVDDENEFVLEDDRTVLFKAEKIGIVIKELEKVDASKLEERAKRFGLNLSGARVVTQNQIDELYVNAGIEGNERHFRLDTLHLNGVDGLTTREIFEYLEDYKPVSLEWVDDISCNVVCQDHIAAALVLLVHSREIRNKEVQKMLSEKSPHHWREGMPHPQKDFIFIRFATNGDKKLGKKKPEKRQREEYNDETMDPVSKNPWGDLCKSWGVYDHQEVFQRKLPKNDYEEEPIEIVKIKNKQLAKRLGKRRRTTEESEHSSSDSEWKKKSKTPRMRMHADDEESKLKKKRQAQSSESDRDEDSEKEIYVPLSIEVVNSHNRYTPRQTTKLSDKFKRQVQNPSVKQESIQSRLGAKVVPQTDPASDASSDSDHNIMSRVQKVSSSKLSSVWSRLDKQNHQELVSSQSDLRQMLKSKKGKEKEKKEKMSGDLRERIGKPKKSNLRIEIDNNYAA